MDHPIDHIARAPCVGIAAVTLGACGAQAATYTYVGGWKVAAGPSWPSVPPAYSGVAAAALIFGGSPTDYATSTMGELAEDIDFRTWVSVYPGSIAAVAQSFARSSGGLYGAKGGASAYVNDGSGYILYHFAFRISDDVPAPGVAPLLIAALAGLGFAARRHAAA
jgi:hypothetical protein